MKRGIFGGSFNPPHMGHIQVMTEVQKKFGLDVIHVIPSNQNPLKVSLEGPTSLQRLKMTELAVESFGGQFIADDREIKRGGPSYTIDTLTEMANEFPGDSLHLILGADLFEQLNQWKNYAQLFELANILVVSRPGYELPHDADELPKWLQKHVADYDFNFAELTTGKSIQFMTIKPFDVSSTQLRKILRTNRPADQFLPLTTEKYAKENKIYQSKGKNVGDFVGFTQFCAQSLFDKKVIQLQGYDIKDISSTTEFVLVGSGSSTKHASSMAENLMRFVKDEYQLSPYHVEGLEEGRWVILDYGSLMIHLFYDYVRQEYRLEELWKNAKNLNLQDKTIVSKKP